MMNDPVQDSEPPRKLGTGMVVVGWLVALSLVSALFAGALERQDNPNAQVYSRAGSDGTTEVRLAQNRAGHYVATGRINGQPVVFLLDTGATSVSVPEGLARRLGLRRGQAGLARTANGTVTTYATRLESVELGDIGMRGVEAHINPGMGGDEVLLGMSFLRFLEFSQRDGVLTLRHRASS